MAPTGCSQFRMHMEWSDSFSIWFWKCWIGWSCIMYIHYCIGWLSRILGLFNTMLHTALQQQWQKMNQISLQWRHNDHDGISNHHPHGCLLTLCGEFTGTGEFPAQRASHAENVSIWWRHQILESRASYGVSSVRILENGENWPRDKGIALYNK